MRTFTVIYRVGGTENFEWRKSTPYRSAIEANSEADKVGKMGYKSLVFDTDLINSLGLPETYEMGVSK